MGFRAFVLREGASRGLVGWVRNTRDGRVEGQAQGVPEALELFEAALRQGPAEASVETCSVEQIEPLATEIDFRITRDG